jgi:hypothetical protein
MAPAAVVVREREKKKREQSAKQRQQASEGQAGKQATRMPDRVSLAYYLSLSLAASAPLPDGLAA